MKNWKRIISLVLTGILLLSLNVGASVPTQYESYAEKLSTIEVFKGTGSSYELDREPTRLEGIVMLIRLLGKEDEAMALSDEQSSVFSDVPPWGVKYTNYAYQNGLTNGIGNNLFGSTDTMNAQTFHTFLLRALGYDDSAGDFSWNTSNKFIYEMGIVDASYYLDILTTTFLRDHVAKSAYDALYADYKGSDITLLDRLVASGDINQSAADQLSQSINNVTDTPSETEAPVEPSLESAGTLEVHFLDVGQALSVLVKDDLGNELLYDAGNKSDGSFIVDYLEDEVEGPIEYLINSHPHEDHIGGMAQVMDNFAIGSMIMSNKTYDTLVYQEVIDKISEDNISVTDPVVNSVYALGDWSFEIVGPIGNQYDDVNNYSIVIRIDYHGHSILLTGDAETLSEKQILAAGNDVSANIVSIPHHGSSSSSSSSFVYDMMATNEPIYAVCSVGVDNSYGHPDLMVMDRYELYGWTTFRTDQVGTVVFTLDGDDISYAFSPLGNPDEPSSSVTTSDDDDNTSVDSSTTGVIITSLDKRAEAVVIYNSGTEDVDITGWKLISVTGNQSLTFPSYILRAGQSITITSGAAAGTGDFDISQTTIWNNTSSDPALLVDDNGLDIYTYND